MIFSLRGPLKESYQADLDVTNPLLVAAPCLLMAIIAHPSTRHFILFRVRTWAAAAAGLCVLHAVAAMLLQAGDRFAVAHLSAAGGCASGAPIQCQQLFRSIQHTSSHHPPCRALLPGLTDPVGLLRVSGGGVGAAAAAHDAEGQGAPVL